MWQSLFKFTVTLAPVLPFIQVLVTNFLYYSPSRLVMDGHRSRILAIKYHPNDRDIFLSGGWDDTIQFWDQREQHSIR